MELTEEEKGMLEGKQGKAVKKSMEILVALGKIYGAKRLVPIGSVQVSGVSYQNLGGAGLEFLEEMAEDGKVKVLTTLNPAGMDLENWEELGIEREFAEKQRKVIEAFKKMRIICTCTCTPYFVGNTPEKGTHVAWGESSAVCYANSVLGAKTNREGGPSALAAALTGRTPEYGMHLEENRKAKVKVTVECELGNVPEFGALGKVIGEKIGNKIPYITGIEKASVEELKSFCASIATYGGTAMFYMEGIAGEVGEIPGEEISVGRGDIEKTLGEMNEECESDFVALGCPHCSLGELERIAELLKGKKVKKELWICVARPVKKMGEEKGYVEVIEGAGGKFACDTCMVVAPLEGRFKCLLTDSAKACFYGRGVHGFKVKVKSLEECLEEAVK